jgi:hypothetical protein
MEYLNFPFGALLVAAAAVACGSKSGSEVPNMPAGGNSNDPLDASVQGGAAGAGTHDPYETCPPLDDPDAGPLATRVCSESPIQPVTWRHELDESNNPICGPIYTEEQSCPLWWGCEPYETALANIAVCDDSEFVTARYTARGWGFLIIEQWLLSGTKQRGYYDEESGTLIGCWEDVGDNIEQCSGTVPRHSSDSSVLTEVRSLCLPDGGIDGG